MYLLDPLQIIEHRDKLKTLYPYVSIDNNLITGFNDVEIDAQIPIAWRMIPSICKRKLDLILYLTTIHILLANRQEALDFETGETGVPSELTAVEVGDISLGMNQNGVNNADNLWWNSTRYGQRAYQFMRLCAKSRVGVMV